MNKRGNKDHLESQDTLQTDKRLNIDGVQIQTSVSETFALKPQSFDTKAQVSEKVPESSEPSMADHNKMGGKLREIAESRTSFNLMPLGEQSKADQTSSNVNEGLNTSKLPPRKGVSEAQLPVAKPPLQRMRDRGPAISSKEMLQMARRQFPITTVEVGEPGVDSEGNAISHRRLE